MADRENSAAYAVDERLTATILNELQLSLDAIFQRMPVKRLYQYDTLQNTLHHTNVASDEKYQRTFADFYKLRGSTAFRHLYFSILEKEKSDSDLDFRRVLQVIFEGCTKVHPSFTSKLLATIDPNLPVYDREVLIRLWLSRFAGGTTDARLNRAVDRYQSINRFHRRAKEHLIFPILIAAFNLRFPAFSHFTPTKKLDLMLWQSNRT